jgi:hypothetical protein
MRIVLLRKIPDESSLRRQWNDLVLQMERPEVFYTCEWAPNTWREPIAATSFLDEWC